VKDFKEKIITINLKRAFTKPIKRRSECAIRVMKDRITKETRLSEFKISNKVNEVMWARGITNCPRKIIVKIINEKGIAKVYLPDETIVKKAEKSEKTEAKAEAKAEDKKEKVSEKTEAKAEAKKSKATA
jgi:ribosomal protein L31E